MIFECQFESIHFSTGHQCLPDGRFRVLSSELARSLRVLRRIEFFFKIEEVLDAHDIAKLGQHSDEGLET